MGTQQHMPRKVWVRVHGWCKNVAEYTEWDRRTDEAHKLLLGCRADGVRLSIKACATVGRGVSVCVGGGGEQVVRPHRNAPQSMPSRPRCMELLSTEALAAEASSQDGASLEETPPRMDEDEEAAQALSGTELV